MRRISATIMAVVAIVVLAVSSVQVFAAQPRFADEAFARVWNRQDRAVYEGRDRNRSWTWGPENISGLVRENYAESVDPDGKRTVQYFDKSRMEINNPRGNPNDRFYVTNGLLPLEMIRGQVQTGNNRFETRSPARISAIGDPGQFPTYADMRSLLDINVNPNAIDRPVTSFLNTDGRITNTFDRFIDDPNTILRAGENNHGVAQAFIDFQNIRGLVFENNQYGNGAVFDPLFVFGLPVTEPYWVNATVGGKEVPVLFQVFERRVLTYNPDNEPPFQVEMGNVGQHFYNWIYGTTPPATVPPVTVSPTTENGQPTSTTTATTEPTSMPTTTPTTTPTTNPYP